MFGLSSIKLAIVAITLLLLATAGYKVHSWRVDSLRASWEVETAKVIGAVRDEMTKQCDDNNRITKENARALRNKYDNINRNYDRLLKYTAPRGASGAAVAGATGGDHEVPRADMPVVCIPIVDAARIGRLNDEQAAALITLQDVVADIYKANGQADLLPPAK